jgi:hypothetical protein
MLRVKISILALAFSLFAPLHSDFSITPELKELLDITGVRCERSLPEIVKATQKAWLRPHGKERWQVEETYDEPTRERIVQICQKMGLLDAIRPKQTHYRYCCILGAALPTVVKRIEFAAQLHDEGIAFDEIVFLTGDRDLDEAIDKVSILDELPKNETQGMIALYAVMDLPERFKRLPLHVVDVPKIATEKGLVRPNTQSTMVYWTKKVIDRGSVLFISNQPYICYQNAVACMVMPETLSFETVGFAINKSYYLRASLLLDTVARWLYQENQLQNRY